MCPVISCHSDVICSGLYRCKEHRYSTKQYQHNRCIALVIKGSEVGHMVLNIQPSKVNMGHHSTVKQRIIESSTSKLWMNIISIDVLILQNLSPPLKTSRCALAMNIVAVLELDVFSVDALLHKWTYLWYEDLA